MGGLSPVRNLPLVPFGRPAGRRIRAPLLGSSFNCLTLHLFLDISVGIILSTVEYSYPTLNNVNSSEICEPRGEFTHIHRRRLHRTLVRMPQSRNRDTISIQLHKRRYSPLQLMSVNREPNLRPRSYILQPRKATRPNRTTPHQADHFAQLISECILRNSSHMSILSRAQTQYSSRIVHRHWHSMRSHSRITLHQSHRQPNQHACPNATPDTTGSSSEPLFPQRLHRHHQTQADLQPTA